MTAQITKKSATDLISEINEALESIAAYVAMQQDPVELNDYITAEENSL